MGKFDVLTDESSAPDAAAAGSGKVCSVCNDTKPQVAIHKHYAYFLYTLLLGAAYTNLQLKRSTPQDGFSNKQWSGKAHSRKV